MAYQVLARKWRPQKFSDVVGQDHVTQTLSNAIKSNRVAHAYLFVGPRGTGKTTIARILAKALNCSGGPKIEFDPNDEICTEIAEGRSIDVIEIDGASNNGVDQVRDLRDNARYAPVKGKYKIYIIDEVHMLSTAAFNALLKILEEPPEHVKFIFATTDIHKVLPTIISRCQRFDLRRISIKDIINRLNLGCVEEGINISEEALLAIARSADGGLRDAESALDQLIAFRGKNIEEEDVLSVFGLISKNILESLSESILQGDIPGIVQIISEMDHAGKDLQRIIIELLENFRNLLLVIYLDNKVKKIELTETQLKMYQEQASRIDSGRILHIIDELIEIDSRMRHSLSKRTLLETGLIRCARSAQTITINELMTELVALKKKDYNVENKYSSQSKNHQDGLNQDRLRESELEFLIEKWNDFTNQTKIKDPLMKSFFDDTVPIEISNETIVVAYNPKFSSEIEHISEQRIVLQLSRLIKDKIGRLLRIIFKPLDINRAMELSNVDKIDPSNEDADNKLRKWYNNSAVNQVVEVFNSRITDIKE